jgi:hypothetical protein
MLLLVIFPFLWLTINKKINHPAILTQPLGVNWWRAWVLSGTPFFFYCCNRFHDFWAGREVTGKGIWNCQYLNVWACIYIYVYVYIYWYDVDLFFNIYSFYYPCYTVTKPIPPIFQIQPESRGEIHIPSLWLSARTQGEPQNGGCLPWVNPEKRISAMELGR